MCYYGIDKVVAAIAFKFLCGIAGIIMGLMLIADFSRLTQGIGIFSVMFVAAALFADSTILKDEKKTATFAKILFWLGIINTGSMFLLMFFGGNLLVNVPVGILLIISSLIVTTISIAEWKSF